MILSPGNSGQPLSKFLNIFKGRTTAIFRGKNGFSKIWQRSAYDHVVRTGEDLRVTIEYILNHPVRRGIVKKSR
jgi:REP element-mobilizing transposase RayT